MTDTQIAELKRLLPIEYTHTPAGIVVGMGPSDQVVDPIVAFIDRLVGAAVLEKIETISKIGRLTRWVESVEHAPAKEDLHKIRALVEQATGLECEYY